MSNNKNEIHESEKKLLLNHDYDGIQEFNFPLPNWWLTTFWGAIIFGIGYFSYYIIFNGPDLKHEYFVNKEEIHALRAEYLAKLKKFDVNTYTSYASSPEMVKHGEYVFNMNCVACHREKGAGDIGPNLTDEYWLFAKGTPETIFPFIIEGNPLNGMPAWGELLGEDDLYAVTAYIMSIQGYPHENPKAPQGEIPEKE
ncbi:MAG: c-type cytochrome [Halobacteriovoraceae bacterium]|nr:c-type cytochrome [Halobacteriovoraceae bacterium]MCB9093938.1 c-type cytochrome [Halobacteriovoraceae bacterium]